MLLAAKPNAACARPCVSFRAHISAAAPPAAKMVVRGGGGCGGSVGGGAAVRARVGRSRARLRLGVRLRRRLRFCNPENFAAAACALMSVARYKKGVKGQKKIWCGKKATEQKFL